MSKALRTTKIENSEYKLRDFFTIPFSISPGMATLRVIDKIIYALIPSLQVLTTAAFIDTAIKIVSGQADKNQIIMPLVWILLLISHQYITFALMGLVRAKMNLKLTEAFRTAITEKRAMLEYRHVENNETWDLIERVGKDPAKRLGEGFDIVLRMADMVVRVVSILLVLVAQVWWAALLILAFSIPLFCLVVRSGKANYEASKEAMKHTRRAQYLQGVLTERDNVEERALFAEKHYAFVGVNGVGKTTLTKLLTGLYDNYTGDILIDGKNLRDFSQAELKAMFSIVYQDFAKYQIRMTDSIGLGNVHGVTEQDIHKAVSILGLDDAVSKLPEAMDTPLGKIKSNGVDLSGGEWQRVAIARSLVSCAPVHILDEPTAALDPVAESDVYEMFETQRGWYA